MPNKAPPIRPKIVRKQPRIPIDTISQKIKWMIHLKIRRGFRHFLGSNGCFNIIENPYFGTTKWLIGWSSTWFSCHSFIIFDNIQLNCNLPSFLVSILTNFWCFSHCCVNLDAIRRRFRSRCRILETVKNTFSKMIGGKSQIT